MQLANMSIGQKGCEFAVQEIDRFVLPGISGTGSASVSSVPAGTGLTPDREQRAAFISIAGTTRSVVGSTPDYGTKGDNDDFFYNLFLADTLKSSRQKAHVTKGTVTARTPARVVFSGIVPARVFGKDSAWSDTALKKGDKLCLVTGQEGGANANWANIGGFRLAAANDMVQGELKADVASGAAGVLTDILLYDTPYFTTVAGSA